ncbi:MAG TPA: ABC transporter substrate-binding protein [Acidimicrobiales bacterium]|nr:ABC transporter substrate-binding protein [Acidimicrobiales bacterium]
MFNRRTLVALSTLTLLGAVSGAVPAAASSVSRASTAHLQQAGSLPTIVIGSENFPEEEILGNLYNDVLRHAGFKTQLRSDLGGRPIVDKALADKALDLFPDYAGSLLVYLEPKDTAQATQLSTDIPALEHALKAQSATVLNAAPAIDTNAFAVTKATAAQYKLTDLSSLASAAPKLTFGAPAECPTYYYCLPGLEKVYGVHFKAFVPIGESGPEAAAYLKNNRVQVAEFDSSDGTILENNFVDLTDNKHLEPADNIIPVIRTAFDTPAVASALNGLSAKLTTNDLSKLNIDVNEDHEDPGAAAAQWLKSIGLT